MWKGGAFVDNPLLETVLNELDITYSDEAIQRKISRIIKSGKAFLDDKFGETINYEEDAQALELLISYCRYGRSNAIEQFSHDFCGELTALALRGALKARQTESENSEEKKDET